MGDKTGIEWTDATWNPLAGCSIVSPGCTNCYAMKMADRFEGMIEAHKAAHGGDPGPMAHYEGTTTRGPYNNKPPVWTGKLTRAPEGILHAPLRWKRPRMVFVNSMSDLFHEDVPDEWIDEIFAIMALCPQHIFQILTKRPNRMMKYMQAWRENRCHIVYSHHACEIYNKREKDYGDIRDYEQLCFRGPAYDPLPNVWLGVSVEDHRRASERIRLLLDTPAAIRFLSMEPLVHPVDLNKLHNTAIKDTGNMPMVLETCLYTVKDRPAILPAHDTAKIDWVILGGESGPDARPMHPEWVRLVRDQCETAGVPFFFKQWGTWYPCGGWPCAGEKTAMNIEGKIQKFRDSFPPEGWLALEKTGKKKAGNMIDGRTWQQMPRTAGEDAKVITDIQETRAGKAH